MERQPRVLGAFAQVYLEQVDRWPGGLGGRLRGELDPELFAAIEKVGRLDWVPLAVHRELAEAVHAASASDARELARRATLAAFQQPFLNSLFRGAAAVMRGRFARFASWTPAAWGLLFRDVGELHWREDEPGRGRLVLENAAPEIASSPGWAEGLAGAFSSFFEVTGSEGEVAVAAGAGRIAILFRWQDAAPR